MLMKLTADIAENIVDAVAAVADGVVVIAVGQIQIKKKTIFFSFFSFPFLADVGPMLWRHSKLTQNQWVGGSHLFPSFILQLNYQVIMAVGKLCN